MLDQSASSRNSSLASCYQVCLYSSTVIHTLILEHFRVSGRPIAMMMCVPWSSCSPRPFLLIFEQLQGRKWSLSLCFIAHSYARPSVTSPWHKVNTQIWILSVETCINSRLFIQPYNSLPILSWGTTWKFLHDPCSGARYVLYRK